MHLFPLSGVIEFNLFQNQHFYTAWVFISQDQRLTEDFIREFKYKVKWSSISQKQILSEDYIREFKDKVDWVFISHYQRLTEDFILEIKKDKV